MRNDATDVGAHRDVLAGTERKSRTDYMPEHSERLRVCNRSSAWCQGVTEFIRYWGEEWEGKEPARLGSEMRSWMSRTTRRVFMTSSLFKHLL